MEKGPQMEPSHGADAGEKLEPDKEAENRAFRCRATRRIKQPPRNRLCRSAGGAPWGEAPQALRGGQKYPSFLRFSMEASEVLSSMRVAPRSLTSTVSVSATTWLASPALLSTGQVQVMSP